MGQNVSTSLTTNVVEAFCGSAGLSRALRACGFAVYPVDFDKNRHASKVHVIDLDLTVQPCVDVFKQMLSDLQPSYIHMGLPCGTCSRAREKPLPKHCKNTRGQPRFVMQTTCLGDRAFLPMIKQKFKVLISSTIWLCMVSIENPHRSWLWPLLALLVRRCDDVEFSFFFNSLDAVVFDSCMRGGRRDKRTKWLSTAGVFSSLAQDCDKSHAHASWQPYMSEEGVIFPTKEEAAYPDTLCSRAAECVALKAQQWKLNLDVPVKLKQLLRWSLGEQNFRHRPLVPEFSSFLHSTEQLFRDDLRLLASPHNRGPQLEANMKAPGQPAGSIETTEFDQPCKRIRATYKYGVWHNPDSFLEKAENVERPANSKSMLNEATIEAISTEVTMDPVELAKLRLRAILRIRELEKDFRLREHELKSTMELEVARRHGSFGPSDPGGAAGWKVGPTARTATPCCSCAAHRGRVGLLGSLEKEISYCVKGRGAC